MANWLTNALAALGTIGLTVGLMVGTGYTLFRYLGDRWLSAKSSERLEAFKHAQQAQLEQLRLTINTTFDRTVKLHNHEFDVLPELWSRLNVAFGMAVSFVSPFQSHADLGSRPINRIPTAARI